MDPSTEAHVQEFLIARRADQFAFLTALVRISCENPPGVTAAARERIVALLSALGLPVSLHKVPDETAAAYGYEGLGNLVIRREFGDGPTLALSAHVDTEPAGANWSTDPLGATIKDGRMFGRGVSDGKGDLAAYVFALLAAQEFADKLTGAIEIHVTFDGGSGGELGARWLLEEEISRPTWAIVPGSAHAVGTAATGVLNLAVEVKGRVAPAGRPQSGADALEAVSYALSSLYRHRDSLVETTSDIPGIDSPTLVVTEISGGAGPLSVPDQVRLLIDRRLLPEENVDAVEAEITNLIGRAVVRVPGVVCAVRRERLLPAIVADPGMALLAESIQGHAGRVLDMDVQTYGVAHETAARHYAHGGVPAFLYGVGPAAVDALNTTGPDECLVLDDLRIATEVLAAVISDWLSA